MRTIAYLMIAALAGCSAAPARSSGPASSSPQDVRAWLHSGSEKKEPDIRSVDKFNRWLAYGSGDFSDVEKKRILVNSRLLEKTGTFIKSFGESGGQLMVDRRGPAVCSSDALFGNIQQFQRAIVMEESDPLEGELLPFDASKWELVRAAKYTQDQYQYSISKTFVEMQHMTPDLGRNAAALDATSTINSPYKAKRDAIDFWRYCQGVATALRVEDYFQAWSKAVPANNTQDDLLDH